MSALSCSAAWAVFFVRYGVAGEEAPDRAIADADPPFRQKAAQFLGGEVGRLLQKAQDQVPVSFHMMGMVVASGPLGAAPVSRDSCRHRLTLAGLTGERLSRRAVAHATPTAARTRTRRSSDNALTMPAGLQLRQEA